MKTTILIFITTIGCYSQIDTTLISGTFITDKNYSSYSIMKPLNLDSINKQYEKAYLDTKKRDLSKLLGEYFESLGNKIVGYEFRSEVIKTINGESYSSQSAYFPSESRYAEDYNKLRIYAYFSDKKEGISALKMKHYAEMVVPGLNIDYKEVKPIYVPEEPTLEGFYKWLNKN